MWFTSSSSATRDSHPRLFTKTRLASSSNTVETQGMGRALPRSGAAKPQGLPGFLVNFDTPKKPLPLGSSLCSDLPIAEKYRLLPWRPPSGQGANSASTNPTSTCVRASLNERRHGNRIGPPAARIWITRHALATHGGEAISARQNSPGGGAPKERSA